MFCCRYLLISSFVHTHKIKHIRIQKKREKARKKSTKEEKISLHIRQSKVLRRRGLGGIPSSRLGLKSGRAGSLAAGAATGDDSSIQDESSLDGEESEK